MYLFIAELLRRLKLHIHPDGVFATRRASARGKTLKSCQGMPS